MILTYIDYGFACIFGIEAILKIIGLGLEGYFRDSGNIYDLVVVVASIISTVISIVGSSKFGAAITFMRALKISRLFKFIMHAR